MKALVGTFNPSRGLLHYYEPLCGPSFEALVITTTVCCDYYYAQPELGARITGRNAIIAIRRPNTLIMESVGVGGGCGGRIMQVI